MSELQAPPMANTRVYQHHHLDSTRWDHVPYRDGDIVITTPYKCGTTWTQRIVAALLHGPDAGVSRELSPWPDARFWGPIGPIAAGLEAQEGRRFMKSHLPLDGTRWDDRVRFVVVGRDARDVFMSLLNHYGAYTDMGMELFNGQGNPGDPLPKYDGDPHRFWSQWITRGWFAWERDGWPFWSAFHHLETWWSARAYPNVLLVHYADLLADPTGEIGRLATFLDVDLHASELAQVVQVSSFDTMKRDMLAAEAAVDGRKDSIFEGGMATFMNKGTNGRWRDLLSPEELEQYEARAEDLDPEVRSWLENGRSAL